MKTFEEHMQDAVGATYPLEDIFNNLEIEDIIEEVNNYAKEVAKQSLYNASELVRYDYSDIDIITESIISEANIPNLD